MMQYTQDYDGRLVSGSLRNKDGIAEFKYPNGGASAFGLWYLQLDPYVKSWDIYSCPSAPESIKYSAKSGRGPSAGALTFPYAYNSTGLEGFGISSSDCGPTKTYNCGVALGRYNSTTSNNPGALLTSVEDPAGTLMIVDGCNPNMRYRPKDYTGSDAYTELTSDTCTNDSHDRYWAGRVRHLDTVNAVFVDGHTKSMPWRTVFGDMDGETIDVNVMKYWNTAANPVN